jgi:hypothetical protein
MREERRETPKIREEGFVCIHKEEETIKSSKAHYHSTQSLPSTPREK